MRSRNGSYGTGFSMSKRKNIIYGVSYDLTSTPRVRTCSCQLPICSAKVSTPREPTCPFADAEKNRCCVVWRNRWVHGRLCGDFNQGLYSEIVERFDLRRCVQVICWHAARKKKCLKSKKATVKWIRMHETFLRCHSTQHEQLIHKLGSSPQKSRTLHFNGWFAMRYDTPRRNVQTVSVYDLFPRKISTVCKATHWQP